jgi:hypothetical protein
MGCARHSNQQDQLSPTLDAFPEMGLSSSQEFEKAHESCEIAVCQKRGDIEQAL